MARSDTTAAAVAESPPPSEIAHSRPLPIKKIFAVGIGNALEFYDFLAFSFFAIQIGRAFFPTSAPGHALLFSLATFGVGFITRPLGGIVIGMYGDRAGRKAAMLLSFSLMGIAILGLALTPSYAQIGLAAPILLLVFRLIQGFALGGEVGPSTAFLVESAPAHRRGLYVSIQGATQSAAFLLAGIVGVSLSHWLTPASLDAWGWRVAFLFGAAVVPVGLYIRRNLPETLHAAEPATTPSTGRRVSARLVVLGLALLGATTIFAYVRTYVTTYAQDTLKLAADVAFTATLVHGLVGMLSCPLAGWCADRYGRKPILLWTASLSLALSLPGFVLIGHSRAAGVLYAVMAVWGALGWAASHIAILMVTESLPKSVRSGALATLYAVAIAVFGGSTQVTIQWLIETTGSTLTPAWYSMAALAVGVIAAVIMRETAPGKLHQK